MSVVATAPTGLSKTLLLKGMQCPKALWLSKNPPDFEFPPQPDLEAKYAAGTEVGILAQQLFPGGVEVPYEGLSVAEQVAKTRELIDAGETVIYEASFAYNGIFVKVDILVRDDIGGVSGACWKVYEVKMGTSVKPINYNDVAIQGYVLEHCGLSICGNYLVHIDNSYVRQGEINVHGLFVAEDVRLEALEGQTRLPHLVKSLLEVLEEGEPDVDIGTHCSNPYDCDFIPYCWRHIPDNSVFDLRGSGVDKFAFYRRGQITFDQLPVNELNLRQRQQVEATLNQQDVINHEGVRTFLKTLWYPMAHLDFESFSSPIPKFDGTRPYQQVPFQYSLHLQDEPGGEARHSEFLAEPNVDPRRALAEKLIADLPPEACILTYNQAFEKGVLRELAAQFPDLAAEIETRLENVRDLMVPFRRRDVYKWKMRGSYSIKEVLPAMVPELGYTGMEIADGHSAMQAYHTMCALEPGEELDKLRIALLEYCKMDTWAMVKILEELEKL